MLIEIGVKDGGGGGGTFAVTSFATAVRLATFDSFE